jgi:3-oxoadipate enol-lactonase
MRVASPRVSGNYRWRQSVMGYGACQEDGLPLRLRLMPHLQLADLDLYYEVTGEGAPLLLLHGLGSSSRDWELQLPDFSRHFRVIAVDVRGHGRSGKPPGPYSVDQFAVDTGALLQKLALGPAHVVGISMGGMIALQLALDSPEYVRSLVIVNSAPELVPRSFGQRVQLWQRLLVARFCTMRQIGTFIGRRLFPKAEQAALLQIFIERWAENDKRAYVHAFRALLGWSVTGRLAEIRQPVLVLAAEHDYVPLAYKEAYVAQMPTARLAAIADSRHATPIDQPEAFNRTVLAFLEEVES